MTISTPQTFEPAGRDIPFCEEGEGPVSVVLLPARGLGISSLGTLASVLVEEGFHLVRIGVRRADGADAGTTLHDLAQDVADVLGHIGLGSAWIGGHAFGGVVARTVALDHPDLVEGVLLLGVESAQEPTDEAARALETAFSAAAEAEAAEAIRVLAGDGVDPSFAWTVFSRARDLRAGSVQGSAHAAALSEEWEPLADGLPVLVLQGSDDRVTPPANGDRLQASAPERVSAARIEGGGHLFALTHAGEIGAEIEDYLAWD